jgi:hypothetical protein
VRNHVVKRCLLSGMITVLVIGLWFGLSVLTFEDNPRIDRAIGISR